MLWLKTKISLKQRIGQMVITPLWEESVVEFEMVLIYINSMFCYEDKFSGEGYFPNILFMIFGF